MLDLSIPYYFLTTKPVNRLLSRNHPEWLYVLPRLTLTTERLVADITFTDGTTTSYTLINTPNLVLRAGEVKYFDVSFSKYNYDSLNPTKVIRSITIKITSSQGDGDSITYYPYTPHSDNMKALYYFNSQGGLDSIICTGDLQESRDLNGLITASPIESVYDNQTAQFKYVDPSFKSNFNLSTGHKPAKEIFAMHDLFSIKRAFEYQTKEGAILQLPIIPEQNQVTFPNERSNMKTLSFTYSYAFDQQAIDRVS